MLAARPLIRSTVILAALCLSAVANAAPTLQNVTPRGIRIGHLTTLTLIGTELTANPRVLINGVAPPQKVTRREANRLDIELKVGADHSAGVHELRLATDTGISNALVVAMDELPQATFTDKLTSLPIALSGSLTGGQILKTTFAGKRGDRVVAEVESRRLGSKARVVLRVLDPRGAQLAYDSRNLALSGDARTQVVLPMDGEYTIEMHDVVYKGPSPGHFRLKVGDFKTVDFAMPLAATAGKKSLVGLFGESALVEVDARKAAPGSMLPVGLDRWHSSAWVAVTPGAEVAEQPQDGTQTLPAAPVGVTGVLSDAGEDRFLLPVKAGERLRFEMFARRVGSPIDGVLTIRGEKGNQLARNDDQNSTSDPLVDYTVPKNVDKLMIGVSDVRNRSGDDFVYRIDVKSLSKPDFVLTLAQDRINVPAGGVRLLRVDAARTAFNGPILLEMPGLPEDVQVSGDRIEAGANFALVTIASRRDKAFAAQLNVIGRAANVEPAVVREAKLKTPPEYAAAQPWLGRALALGLAPAGPLTVEWADGGGTPLETVEGGEHELKLKLTRNMGVQGDVRLKLLATQVIPKKKVKQNNKEVTIDDLDKALRLPADAKAAANVTEYATKLLTPAKLPKRVWTVLVQAELLDPKTQKPKYTAYTMARSLRTKPAPKPAPKKPAPKKPAPKKVEKKEEAKDAKQEGEKKGDEKKDAK